MKNKTTNIKIYLKTIFLLCIGITLMIACTKDKEDDLGLDKLSTHKVNESTIKLIAENFFKNSNTKNKGIDNSKTIKDIIEHKTTLNNSVFYVINYIEGGFIIIASDNRISPILAFSATGTFSSDPSKIISPVAYWIETVKNNIQSIVNNNESQSRNVELEWEVLSLNNFAKTKKTDNTNRIMNPDPDPIECTNVTTTIGPYLSTIWGQGDGYNNLVPLSCSYSYDFGYKAPTGCAATAMAQVLRYFQKPYTYNWANMPNNGKYTYGTYDLQLLMKNAGTSVNMNYGCSESSAYNNSIAPAFINYFNYSSASNALFNRNTVVQNLNNRQPVILTGSYNGEGHAWVCDGYQQTTFYSLDQDGNCTGVTYNPVLHMNWGWDNKYNGYYSVGNFNPGGSTGFNSNVQMIYNINL